MPAAYVWTGNGLDHLASTALNWHPVGVPTVGDSVSFDGVGNGSPNARERATWDIMAPGLLASFSIAGSYFQTVTLERSLDVDNLLVSAPGMGAHGRIDVKAGASLVIDHGTIGAGDISGAGNFSVSRGASPVFNVTGQSAISTNTWSIAPSATVNISATLFLGGGTVAQNGTVNWTAGMIRLVPATVTNTGIFKAKCDQTMDGTGTFNNVAVFRKENSVGTTRIDASFNGVGQGAAIEVNTGTLQVASSGNDSGTINVDPAADTIAWVPTAGGMSITRTVQGTLVVSGRRAELDFAEIVIPEGSAFLNNVETFQIGGMLGIPKMTGPGPATITGRLVWERGEFQDFQNNRLTITGRIDITTNNQHTLIDVDKLILTNFTTWDGGAIGMANSKIENYGNFEIQGDNPIGDLVGGGGGGGSTSSFENMSGPQGREIVTKTAGAGRTEVEINFINTGDLMFNGFIIRFHKTIRQDSGGLTELSNGTLDLNPQAYFYVTGGTVRWGGTIGGRMDFEGGNMIIGAGQTITVEGNYTQGFAAILVIEYRPNGFGLLRVLGTAGLGGTLTIDTGGNNLPNVLQPVITAATLVNTFNTVFGCNQIQYDTAGTPNSVLIR